MEATLWSSLPMALVAYVVAKLPFVSLVRMRLVSKSWNSLICSEGFSPPNPNPQSVLLHSVPVYKDRDLSNESADYTQSFKACDTVKGDWHQLFLNCPDEVLDKDIPLPRLAATGGGLLCFDISSPTENDFIVCNPLTSKWKRLPRMELHPWPSSETSVMWRVAGLAYDENCRSYKLVVAGFCRDDGNEYQSWFLKGTQVYDSITESWKLAFQDKKIIAESCTFENAFNKSLFWNNHLYVVTSMILPWGHDVAIFSMKKGTWILVSAFCFIDDVSPAYLVCHEDQVFLVADRYSDETFTQYIGLWKLDSPDMEAMRTKMFLEHPENPSLKLELKCLGRDELNWACFKHRNSTSFIFCTQHMHTILVRVIGEETWSPFPYTQHLKVEDPHNLCAFEPSLSASI